MNINIEISDRACALIRQGFGWYFNKTDEYNLPPVKVEFTSWKYNSYDKSVGFSELLRAGMFHEKNYYLRKKDCGYTKGK